MKEVLIVSIGSFFGGGMRYWGIKDGAILHGDCLSVRNDGGECGGMPHHRVPLGIELAGRGDGCRHLPNCCSPRDSAEDSLPSLPL